MREALDRLFKFIDSNHPGYEECMVCKGTNEKGNPDYFLVEKHKGSGCDLYIINSHMWFDYEYIWKDVECPWEIIFKTK